LQRDVSLNPTYDPGFGVLTLLVQSGDLALLEDRVLRARLAGLDALLSDYLGNQEILLELMLEPHVVFGTGSVVFDFSTIATGDLTLPSAGEEVRETEGKYFVLTLAITDLLIGQGEALLAELGEIVALLP